MTESSPEFIRSVRVFERASEAGPMTYEVQALWNVGNWRVTTYTSRLAADKYAKGLLEGVDASDGINLVFQYNHNEIPE